MYCFLQPGGSLFITTPNRTLYSWLSVIIIGETFNLIPKGTHELEKFICPHELQSILEINCKFKINYFIVYIIIVFAVSNYLNE